MLGDLVYGPRIAEGGWDGAMLNTVFYRALTLDMESLVECAVLLDRRYGPSAFYIQDAHGEREIPREELHRLAAADRRRLRLISVQNGEYGAGAFDVTFYDKQVPGIYSAEPYGALRLEVAQHFLDRGVARVNWWRVSRFLTFMPFVLLLTSWIVATSTASLSAAVAVFGWVIVASAFVFGVIGYRSLRPWLRRSPGHLIRMESRADTAARRADEKKNLKVALITAPVTLAVGTALAAILGLLNL
jgi:hypothetical protein